MKNKNRKRFYVRRGTASWARRLWGVVDREAAKTPINVDLTFVGYYETRAAAEATAAEYNRDGYKEKVWFDGDGEASYR